MANGPKFRVPFRRRREGKTNYHRRLKLIRSHKKRLVIRTSNKHTNVQVMDSLMHGDKLVAESHSIQLKKIMEWGYNTSNLPSAYLTGYLGGLRAKKAGVEHAILDVGILVHDSQVKAALLGFLDADVDVPVNREWFSEHLEQRVTGQHIQDYAEMLSKEDSKKYKKMFAAVLANNGNPKKIVADWEKAKKTLEGKV